MNKILEAIKDSIEYLVEKIDEEHCRKCPYARGEKDYYCDDWYEWCGVNNESDMEVHWYCFMPNFVKKLIRKRYLHKVFKGYEDEINESEEE